MRGEIKCQKAYEEQGRSENEFGGENGGKNLLSSINNGQ
jgi:hypothetical protein